MLPYLLDNDYHYPSIGERGTAASKFEHFESFKAKHLSFGQQYLGDNIPRGFKKQELWMFFFSVIRVCSCIWTLGKFFMQEGHGPPNLKLPIPSFEQMGKELVSFQFNNCQIKVPELLS